MKSRPTIWCICRRRRSNDYVASCHENSVRQRTCIARRLYFDVVVESDRQALVLLHDESLAEHGGGPGIRDEGLLESALARPRNVAAYGAPDIADLAASYGVGLAKNHPFVEGNKRAAFLSIGLFLMLHGRRLVATQLDTTMTMLGAAAGDIDEAALAAWIREHSRKR